MKAVVTIHTHKGAQQTCIDPYAVAGGMAPFKAVVSIRTHKGMQHNSHHHSFACRTLPHNTHTHSHTYTHTHTHTQAAAPLLAARVAVGGMTPPQVACIAWAYARLQFNAPILFRAILKHALAEAGR